jgi:hypothetical protein
MVSVLTTLGRQLSANHHFVPEIALQAQTTESTLLSLPQECSAKFSHVRLGGMSAWIKDRYWWDGEINDDGFVKSPSAAFRLIFSHCGVPVSTPHS